MNEPAVRRRTMKRLELLRFSMSLTAVLAVYAATLFALATLMMLVAVLAMSGTKLDSGRPYEPASSGFPLDIEEIEWLDDTDGPPDE